MNEIIMIIMIYLFIGVVVTVFIFEDDYINIYFKYDNILVATLLFVICYPFLILKEIIKSIKNYLLI